MTDPLAEIAMRVSRRSAFYLAAAATGSTTLWAWGADFIKDAVTALAAGTPLCQGGSCVWPVIRDSGGAILAGLACIVLGLWLAYRFAIPAARGAFLNSVAVVRRNQDAQRSRALILTLSDLPLPERLKPGQADEVALANEAIARAKTASTSEQRQAVLDDLCDPKGKWGTWRWQQPLRLFRHNFDTVEVIGFVISKQAAPQFEDLMAPLLGGLMPQTRVLFEKKREKAKAIDLSDYNAVTAALDRSCRAVLTEARCEPKDLCIDITSGTKAYSAAATVKTLNSTAIFSYVETAAPYEVLTYDASLTM